MAEKLLMFPFTHGIDGEALEQALQIAQYNEAALVLLAITITSQEQSNRSRLEKIQQAQDLQVLAQQKAVRYGVDLHYREVRSKDFIHAILLVAQEQMCEAILLFLRNGQGVCLQKEEIKQVLEQNSYKFYLVRMQEHATQITARVRSFWQWFNPPKSTTLLALETYTGSRKRLTGKQSGRDSASYR